MMIIGAYKQQRNAALGSRRVTLVAGGSFDKKAMLAGVLPKPIKDRVLVLVIGATMACTKRIILD